MKKLFALLLFVAISQCYSQMGGDGEVYLKGDFIDATFEGGDIDQFYRFIIKNYDTSKIEKKGQLIFTFDVNELGEIKKIKIVQDLGTNSALELIRVLLIAPKWEPAKRGGKPASINFKMPLTFK